MNAGWYRRRLRPMSTRELAGRVVDQGRRRVWAPGRPPAVPPTARPAPLATPLPDVAVPDVATRALVDAANDLLDGRWEFFGVTRTDMAAPDWFADPVTGRRAPQARNAFRINPRTGLVKQVWELSRHHHLTILAAAWRATGDDRYAEAVDGQLRSWWRENPWLSGVHWTSGIELGVRLIAWAWVRRLLDGWPGVRTLFEGCEDFVRQLYWHQRYLAAFESRGSSANNHVIAEAAGRLVAACAFPWFPESDRWRGRAATVLERELQRNTFPSGLNRELASDYQCFVAELGLSAAVEAEAAGQPLGDGTWALLCRMVDAAAAVVDEHGRPPRQGDGDDGRALLLDAPAANHWESLLAAGGGLFGRLPWWPAAPAPDVRSTLLTALADDRGKKVACRPQHRPSRFSDAGLTVLRTDDSPQIWCRCDGGPHGYLAIAAHAHADALSVEVRHGGVDVLADPGTYCYHGQAEWRAYFRSTLAHNTLELDGLDQSETAGPFLWASAAVTTAHCESGRCWSAEHDGYLRLDPPATHRRTVRLVDSPLGQDVGQAAVHRLEIRDRVVSEGAHRWRLAFHLGPLVDAVVDDGLAQLTWPGAAAVIRLPTELEWSRHKGATDPILGWYSAGFGQKSPSVTLVGSGTIGPAAGDVITVIDFSPGARR